jgi:hypothetical protein
MKEAVLTSETSVNINLTKRCYIPEDSKLHTRRRENLKSHIEVFCFLLVMNYKFLIVSEAEVNCLLKVALFIYVILFLHSFTRCLSDFAPSPFSRVIRLHFAFKSDHVNASPPARVIATFLHNSNIFSPKSRLRKPFVIISRKLNSYRAHLPSAS